MTTTGRGGGGGRGEGETDVLLMLHDLCRKLNPGHLQAVTACSEEAWAGLHDHVLGRPSAKVAPVA